jgi:hypothetical protein
MNPYFVMLVWFNMIRSWFNMSFLFTMSMSFLKNTRLVLSLLLPDPKGSVEHMRNNVVKVTYVDPTSEHGVRDKTAPRHYLLKYSNPPLTWTKMRIVTNTEFARVEQLQIEKMNAVIQKFDPSNAPSRTIEDDIEQLAGTPSSPPKKFNYRDYESIDVTEDILELAGPGKDFFGCPLTVHDLDIHWHTLIISYGKGLKIFHSTDIVKL